MSKKHEGIWPSEEHDDQEQERTKIEKLKTILWFHSGERALGHEVKFTQDEFITIVDAWPELEKEIQDLALVAYPQIAAVLLNRKLETH